MTPASKRPLSALLSQLLIAFTVELDNEFERRMSEAGYPGAHLSLVVWSNLVRFCANGEVTVRDLESRALAPRQRIQHELGCLERWRVVELLPNQTNDQATLISVSGRARRQLRVGWGSGRGIRADWIVRLTAKGIKSREIWPTLLNEIERRWEMRFGRDEISRLRRSLEAVVDQLDIELPHGLPSGCQIAANLPARNALGSSSLALPTLLSQLLLAFAIAFNRLSDAPLWLCANALRVLGKEPIPVGEIPHLTGGSPEQAGIGWQLKAYVVVEADPTKQRGKVVRLNPRGLKAQHAYYQLNSKIEEEWEQRFGKDEIQRLRASLLALFDHRTGNEQSLAIGLIPLPGTVRAGAEVPSLGRREIGAAARQRRRNLIAQTEAYVRDPSRTLPHFPLWDMNRGFGP
ncbi:MAG TPA: hypothetical protein VE860_11505 [Chthoniobacterales bacterium]|jgi:DNA-binding MarR family transcriptional regulator|nr:hypothetical protein [Chthoniobacterales bacterium]